MRIAISLALALFITLATQLPGAPGHAGSRAAPLVFSSCYVPAAPTRHETTCDNAGVNPGDTYGMIQYQPTVSCEYRLYRGIDGAFLGSAFGDDSIGFQALWTNNTGSTVTVYLTIFCSYTTDYEVEGDWGTVHG